jgi:hypothetical protein
MTLTVVTNTNAMDMTNELDLETLLMRLHDCEIACWIATGSPGHTEVCLIAAGGREVRGQFAAAADGRPRQAIGQWLLDTACAFYPDCAPRLTATR